MSRVDNILSIAEKRLKYWNMTDNNKDQEDINPNGNGEIDTQDGNTAATASSSSGKKNKKGKAKKSEDQAVTSSQANLTPEQQGNLKKAMEYLSLQAAGFDIDFVIW